MPARKIIFWRHGQTDQNLAARIQGITDNPLNETGIAQAKAVAPEIAQLGITKIYSSSLYRAQQTAQTVAEIIGLPINIDERLRERSYGEWEGKTSAEIRVGWREQWEVWRSGQQPLGVGVEPRLIVGDRVKECVTEAVQNAADDDVLLFVAHGGSIVNGIMRIIGMNPDEWAGLHGLDNCHWALLEARPNANPPWRIRSYNRTTAAVDPLADAWRI